MSTECCTTPDILSLWLQGGIAQPQASEIELHVNECAQCQRVLEELTRCRIRTSPHGTLHPDLQRIADVLTEKYSRTPHRDGQVAEPDTAPVMEPLIQVPGYVVERLLGRGGMGRVYLARHRSLNREVAIKALAPHLADDPQLVARLREEARAMATISHPNVVRVFDLVETSANPALVLEYVSGGTLAQFCGKKPVDPETARSLLVQVARGVHAAHEHGIIHRDLKPANVLLDGMVPRVTDFGLARSPRAGDRMTISGDLFGTPEYMSPEQIQDGVQAATPASDVYALGAILYELLTGRPPFTGATAWQTMQRAITETPVPPGQRVAGIPEDLERVCLRALEKASERRYASALEFADALSGGMAASNDSRPAGMAHEQTGGKAITWTRRWKSAAMAVTILCIPAMTVLLLNSWSDEGPADGASPDTLTSNPVDEFTAGSLWKGTFAFLPAAPDEVHGSMELEITHREAGQFEGIYSSEERKYAWNVRGELQGRQIRWRFASAIRDNEAQNVVGLVEVTGTIAGRQIDAIWKQDMESARLHFDRVQ